jgi:ribosomal protein S18 acetylase RimI-like enzyme
LDHLQYTIPSTQAQLLDAVALFQEYANSLDISLEFQNFQEELNSINSMYGSPTGCLLLVYEKELPIACAAYRKIEEGVCELKRMYIKPPFRGKQIAQSLLDMLTKKASINGYDLMRLDTLDTMLPALGLYRKNGFYEIEAYCHNPNEGVVYMEKKLQP